MGKLFKKVFSKNSPKAHWKRDTLNEKFAFCAHHSMTLQSMRLINHIASNLNKSMLEEFLDIKKAWHSCQVTKLSESQFLTSKVKLVSLWLSKRKFKVSEGEIHVPRKIQARMPQDSVLFTALYSLYMNDAPPNPSPLCSWQATGCREGYVLRNLQCGLTQWNHGVSTQTEKLKYFLS